MKVLCPLCGEDAYTTEGRNDRGMCGVCGGAFMIDPPRGSDSRTSPDGSVTVVVPCDETSGELP